MGEAAFAVVLTEAAADDLGKIDEYWTHRGEAWRGEKYYRDLRTKAEQELSDPASARHGRRVLNKYYPDAREILAFGVYRIIYHIDEAAGIVNVLRFWHAHRDEPRSDV